jgi:hypothetical protein
MVIFWVFWVLGLFGGGYWNRGNYGYLGGFGITWLLILILGLKVFGFDLK